MFEGMLNIDIDDEEIASKIIACSLSSSPFEVFGRSYRVESISRNIDAANQWYRVVMRQINKLEWRGPEDGLPPVGLECIFRGPFGMIYTVKVIAHGVDEGRKFAVVQAENDILMGGAEMFERILSPEEVAQQEREDGIRALHTIMSGPGYRKAAERLYKAGVRAPEVK